MTAYTPEQIVDIILQKPQRIRAFQYEIDADENAVSEDGMHRTLAYAQTEIEALGFDRQTVIDILNNWAVVLGKEFSILMGSKHGDFRFNLQSYAGIEHAVVEGQDVGDALVQCAIPNFTVGFYEVAEVYPCFLDPSIPRYEGLDYD